MSYHKEIELKFSMNKYYYNKAKELLNKIAQFVEVSHEIDDYYSPKENSFLRYKNPFEWLSIRNRNGKIFVNYKHYFPENIENPNYCDEFEIGISDAVAMEKVFYFLNFEKLITVEKKRSIYKYKNEMIIGMDDVKELGFFIEIEAISNMGDVAEIKKKLFDFAIGIGINVDKIEYRGYPQLIMMI